MGSQALTRFLIQLALDSEFARQWATVQEAAKKEAGKKDGEDPRIAFLDQIKDLDEADKTALLSRNLNDVEAQIVSGSQHTFGVRSQQHTVVGGQNTAQSVTQGPFRITITVETR